MSIPRLNVPTLPGTFAGRLYFITGPGLGDTVNDFRIVEEVRQRFPRARPVLYADARWKALCEQVPDPAHRELRYHQPAPSGHPGENGRDVPYHRTMAAILDEIETEHHGTEAYLALGGFKCPDQLARGESGLAMKARAVGLSLPEERRRPLLPLPAEAGREAGEFLGRAGLAPGRFLVVAPHTHPDKMWPASSWEHVLAEVRRVSDLGIVVVGPAGMAAYTGERVVSAAGLPLPVAAAVIGEAAAFVGLESGLTHLAAAFDLPIVTLNPYGQFPAFLVEANSPFRWTILTPGLYGDRPIPPETVSAVLRVALATRTPPACPLCAGAPFVLGAEARGAVYLCRCGLLFRTGVAGTRGPNPARGSQTASPLPLARDGLGSSDVAAARPRPAGEKAAAPNTVTFEHWDPVRLDPARLIGDDSARELWWTWDAATRYLRRHGWWVRSSRLGKAALPEGSVPVTVELACGEAGTDGPDLVLPWGVEPMQVPRHLYERWLTWGAFHHQGELEGLGWLLAQQGETADGEAVLRLALRQNLRWKTVARWLRVRFGAAPETRRVGVA